MTVLLHKANLLRRPEWRMETLVVDDGGALSVVKRRPAGTAGTPSAILGTLAERHAQLSAVQQTVTLPRILETGETSLRVEHVAGETSLARLERALAERRFATAHQEIADVLDLLDDLPGVDADPHADAGFVAAFDPQGRAAGAGVEPCLLPGLYDFGLGNLVSPAGGGRRTLVDWEWTFPWPMSRAFVRFVIVRNAAEYLQAPIRALTSDALPGLVFFDNTVIPEVWATAAGLDTPTVRRFVALEAAFQDWLHLMHRPSEHYALHAEPRRVTTRQDENATLLVARLEHELAAARNEAGSAADQLAARDAELQNARRLQADLTGTRYAARHLGTLVRRRLRPQR